jgi:hypothetical protein
VRCHECHSELASFIVRFIFEERPSVHEADVRCFIYLQSSCRRLWAPARIVVFALRHPIFRPVSPLPPFACPAWCETKSGLQPAPIGRLSCYDEASAELCQTHIRRKRRCESRCMCTARLSHSVHHQPQWRHHRCLLYFASLLKAMTTLDSFLALPSCKGCFYLVSPRNGG